MGFGSVKLYRILGSVFLVSVLIVLIVILSLQWRTVSVLHYGLLYNSGKKGLDSNTLYYPGRYYVGAGSYFMEFPSTQKSVIFKSDNKQAFDATGAYMMPVIVGLTNDGLSINMSMVINYKLLDPENKAVPLGDQLVYIFNQLYGGTDEEEISDSVGLIAEADIMQIISLHPSSDFWTKRGEITQEYFTAIKSSLKDYYITLTSVIVVNEEFPFRYQDAISEVMAEMQQIEQKQNELDAQQIIKDTAIQMANLNAQIMASNAQTAGAVYAARVAAQKTAEVTYNGVLNTAVGKIQTNIDTTQVSTLFKFFYLVSLKMAQTSISLYLPQPKELQDTVSSSTG